MTLMLLFGAVAALHCLRLLVRSATVALPICTAIGLGFALRDLGLGPLTAPGTAVAAGFAILALGRGLVGGTALRVVKLCIILAFASAAAFAGYQAGTAIALLGGVESAAQPGLAFLSGLGTGYASWRDLVSSKVSAERPAMSV